MFTQSSFTLVQGAERGWVSPQLIVAVAVTQSSLQGQHFGKLSFILQQMIVNASLAFWAKPLSNPQTQHFWLNHTSHPQNLFNAMKWFHVCELWSCYPAFPTYFVFSLGRELVISLKGSKRCCKILQLRT